MSFGDAVLAQVDPGRVSAGPLGLLVMLLMGLATVMLVRSMNGHLRRLPRQFGPMPEPKAEVAADAAGDEMRSSSSSSPTDAADDYSGHDSRSAPPTG